MIDELQDINKVNSTLDVNELQFQQKLKAAFVVLSNKSPTNQELTQTHQALAELMKHQYFLDGLIQLIIDFQISTQFPNISTLGVTTLSTFLKHQQSRGTLVKKIQKNSLNTKLISIFMNPQLQDNIRLLIVKQYLAYIYAPGMQSTRHNTINALCNKFSLLSLPLPEMVMNDCQFFLGMNFRMVNFYLPVIQTILKGPIENVHMKSIVTNFYKPVAILTKHSLIFLQKTIVNKNEAQFIRMSSICQKLVQFYKQLVIITSRDGLYIIKFQVLKEPYLSDIIIKILCMSMQPKLVENQVNQLAIATGSVYVHKINAMKKQCMEILKYLSKVIISIQGSQQQKDKEEYHQSTAICSFFMNNIPKVLVKEFLALNYPHKDLPHKDLYKATIKVMSNMVRINKFYNESYSLRNNILYNVCLPLLQRNPNESIKSAADYKGIRQDILNMHGIDIVQNAVGYLIEGYVDKIDGSLIHLSQTAINLIQFQLTANPNNLQKLPKQLIQSQFFKTGDYLMQIECGLTVLALLSYMAPGRDDIINLIEALMIRREQFLLRANNSGTLKCAIYLCYTFYVDNFYLNLIEKKSNRQDFHIKIIQNCCETIQMYTCPKDSEITRQERLLLQIGAEQALDCLNNCITQKHFIKALFWSEQGWSDPSLQRRFLYIFQFLCSQLNYKLNITVIDTLTDFFKQSLKNQCQYGSAIQRYQYQYKHIPFIIRNDLSILIGTRIYTAYMIEISPNRELLKNKIMYLLEIILTCCQHPDQLINVQFFGLPVDKNNQWDIMKVLDIYARRMVVFKQQGKVLNLPILGKILQKCIQMFPEIFQQCKYHSTFGIIVNLMVLQQQIVDILAIHLGNFLIKLLKQQDQNPHYDDQLQGLIQKTAYLNMLAIHIRFTIKTKTIWCQLVDYLQQFFDRRSTKGIIASRSSLYIGKLLTISLSCLFNMLKSNNLGNLETTKRLWTNILRNGQIYTSLTEKQIVANILIRLLSERQIIDQNDQQCKQCFKIISTVLYFAYSSAFKKGINDGDDRCSSSSSSDIDSEKQPQENDINYKDYTINSNQFVRKQEKDKYILDFKQLCHQLKQNSGEFLKASVDALSPPMQNFVKQQVFYYESSISKKGMRKLLKVKK